MTKNDFLRMASIHVCAALVKCYDESTVGGIINNEDAHDSLVQNAIDIAGKLHDQVLAEGWFDDKLFADEPEKKAE